MQNAAENSHTKPIICYVTDGNMLGGRDRAESVLGKIRIAVAAGVDWVQIREKDLSARALLVLAREAVQAVAEIGGGASVIMNDRLDVALAAGAAGVHLGGESISASDVASWCRAGNAPVDFKIGVSCHSLEQAHDAERAGASYVFFGPIFDTPSKRPFGPPQGIPGLVEVRQAAKIPVIAIGGINEKNAGDCLRAGAAGIAAIRMFQAATEPRDLANAIERLRQIK